MTKWRKMNSAPREMHKAQACEVFREYCAETNEQSEHPAVEYGFNKAKKGMK